MSENNYFITSESVAEGHPDKLCDQVSDAVLDEVLRQDIHGRVACETYVTMGLIIVGGELTTKGYIDIHKVARNTIREVGYTDPKFGLDYETCAIINAIHTQSPDIALGVDVGGAGDQGMMLGYACRETPELMPLPIMLAHRLVRRMAELRRQNILNYLGPDGKSQVTVEYVNSKPRHVHSVVLACQHTEEALDKKRERMSNKVREELIERIAKPVLKEYLNKDTKFYVNETGRFLIGGPQSDTGMTGRKIIVDTYGGVISHGGGAFSGKDPTKVDRSAAYMARYIAKNIVESGIAERCSVHLAYVIGHQQPLAITIDTYGTGKIKNSKLIELVRKNFDLTPKGIIKKLDLLKPLYKKTACYGHFGREDEDFAWEKTDMVEALKKKL